LADLPHKTGPLFKARNFGGHGEVSSFGLSARFSVLNRGSFDKFFDSPLFDPPEA
jgi:hypothetical protein